jgi:hypothetical protein
MRFSRVFPYMIFGLVWTEFLVRGIWNTLGFQSQSMFTVNLPDFSIPDVADTSKSPLTTSSPPPPCLHHNPIRAGFKNGSAEFAFVEEILQLPSPKKCGTLRRDWSNLSLQSDLAKEFESHQTNCALPVVTFEIDNSFGIGSHLHQWSQAICSAMEQGYRLRSSNPKWLWMDKAYCDPAVAKMTPMLCYFPSIEFRCDREEDMRLVEELNATLADSVIRNRRCKRTQELAKREEIQVFRNAAMEYIFQNVSELVILEAGRQLGLLFGGRAPRDLITVHIRWGDKFYEMKLVKIADYIAGVEEILSARGGPLPPNMTTANIYLATEDPRAVRLFREAAPPTWNIFVDRTFEELSAHRPALKRLNHASYTTRNTKGRAGLLAFGSLLVALEADDFVLTTRSNWSRLMDELRRSVIDPRCGNCTKMVDLKPGTW